MEGSHVTSIILVLVIVVLLLGGASLLGWWMWSKYSQEVFLLYGLDLTYLKSNAAQADLVAKYKDMVKKAGYEPVTLEDLRAAAKSGASWCGFGYFIHDNGRSELLTTGFPNGKGLLTKDTCPALDNTSGSYDYSDNVLYDKTDKVTKDTVSWGVLVKGKKPALDKVLALPFSSDVNPGDWFNMTNDQRAELIKSKKYKWSRDD